MRSGQKIGLAGVVAAILALAVWTACGGDDTGNAPAIPHAVTSTDTQSCLACHKNGDNGTPVTSHPDRGSCTDCHKS